MTLEIYMGPMYAGKTSKMIQMYESNRCTQKIAIDYEMNTRKSNVTFSSIQNHNSHELMDCYKTKFLAHLKDESYYDEQFKYYQSFLHAQYIYINECQFFPDLKEMVISWLKQGKHIYLYGLDGDFKMDLFGQTSMLIPYCSYIEKLKGICKLCSNPSVVSHRTSTDMQVFLPNADNYIPLCLKCKSET